MRPAALYARVSTRHQEEEATIESQMALLLDYARQEGYDVPAARRFVDQGVSGKRLARPGLDRLRDAAVAGAFEVLLCLSPDRLARNLMAQQVLLQELRDAAVQVIFLNQPTLEDNPQAQLLVNIQGAFAEYERVVISERMRRGRLYRLRMGQSVPSQAPYGYRFQPSTRQAANQWVCVPAEAMVVRRVFAEYAQGQVSLYAMAKRLNEAHIPSPEGKRWGSATLGRLLHQAAYKGTAYYNRHATDYSSLGQSRRLGRGTLQFPRYNLRPSAEWIAVCVPPLVDEALWQAAQERLRMQARYAQRNSQRTYLLRGLLVCGVCGHTLQGRTQRQVSTYVCAYGAARRDADVPAHRCSLRADVVEPLIWQALEQLLQDPQRIQAAWERHKTQDGIADEMRQAQQRQTVLGKQRQRLLDAYQAELISLQELRERQQPLNAELAQVQERLAQVPSQAVAPISLERFTEGISRALHARDIETQQEVMRLLIERIVVTDEALTVEHIIPTVPNSRLHPMCRVTWYVIRGAYTLVPVAGLL